jgi:hemolysin activation/secretion protein
MTHSAFFCISPAMPSFAQLGGKRWPLNALCLAVGIICNTSIWAQTASPAPTAGASNNAKAQASPVFAIRGFNVKGENPLSVSQTSQVLAPFLRNDATLEVLQKATLALESALRDAGYGLHKVSLPPQEVGDAVTLEIVKFVIGRVVVTGNEHFSEENIRRSLPELQENGAPNFKTLAVQTAAANENPSKQITLALRESGETDKIDAALQVRDSRPWNISLSANNSGNEATGNDRLTLALSHSNLFDRDHQAILAHTTSVERTAEVKQWGLSYRVPLYVVRGTVGVSYTKSDVIGSFGSFSSTGAGSTKGINYTLAFEPDGGRRSFLTVGLDDKLYGATKISTNGQSTTVGLNRRSRPLVVSYNARLQTDKTYTGYNLEFAANTGSGSHNNLTAYRSEYSNPVTGQGISTRSFKILRAGYNHIRYFENEWQLLARTQAQLSADALIAGEQFGLGGLASVRGTDDRAITGDSGMQVNLEVNSPVIAKSLRFVGFIDAGWLSNRDADGQRRVSSDRLASVGLGLRFSHASGVSFTADYGRLITGSKLPLATNSNAPQKGDDKLHVNLSVRF